MDEDGDKTTAGIMGKAAGGVSMLASVQLFSRGLMFLLNVILARSMTDPSALGISAVQLYLLNTGTLSLVREGLRRTGLRLAASNRQELINLSWWVVVAGCVLTPFVCTYFIYSANETSLGGVSLEDYIWSVQLVGVSIVFELLSEPMFIAAQGGLAYSARSLIDAAGMSVRCVVQVVGVLFFRLNLSAFAYGYIGYGLTLLVGYGLFFARQLKDSKDQKGPAPQKGQGLWQVESWQELLPSKRMAVHDVDLRALFVSLNLQQVWKLALQEGEKIVMMTFHMPAAEQAVYSLVFNLGSLVVRLVFYPIEESAFAVYGKLNDIAQRKSTTVNQQVTLTGLVSAMSKFMTFIGMIFTAFAPSYCHFLLLVLYGPKWANDTNAAQVLGFYCVYVGIIAVNGITEAFVQAVGSESEIRRFNNLLLFFSVVNIGSSILLFSFGSLGLIASNSITMLIRIFFNVRFIAKWKDSYNGGKSLGSVRLLFPSITSCLVFLLGKFVVSVSEVLVYDRFHSLYRSMAHVFVGILTFTIVSAVVFRALEFSFVLQCKDLWRFVRSNR